MELKYLRLIQTIAEAGSIRNASEQLHLTQSALSHQLREIEQRLGIKVFLRKRNQWTLTPEGSELVHVAQKVLAEVDRGLMRIKKLSEGTSGTLRIATVCYTFYRELPGFIQKMAALYPNLTIDLVLEATRNPLEELLAGALDLAITTETTDNPALVFEPIDEDEVWALCHREHRFHQLDHVSPQDFAQEKLLVHSLPLETVFVYQHYLLPAGIKPRIQAIPLTEVALEMVAANSGVACFPKWALKRFLLPDEIGFVRLGAGGLRRTHFVAYRKEDVDKQAIVDLISNLKEERRQ